MKGERDRDPFGFKLDIPSLRKDSRIQSLLISKTEISNELQSTITPPEQHQDSKNINEEIADLSEGVNSFAGLLLYRLVFRPPSGLVLVHDGGPGARDKFCKSF